MKNLQKRLTPLKSAFFVFIAFFAFSCEQDPDITPVMKDELMRKGGNNLSKTNTFYSPATPVGGGIIKTMVEINHAGEPIAVGIIISERTLMNLPEESSHFVLPFHQKAADVVPFKHVLLDWNPEGHEPPGVYDLPHFDFHFYMTTSEERMEIGVNDPKAEIFPAPEYMPADYVPIPGYVPMMGKHWVDRFAPELQRDEHHHPFTHTFIFGSYNGEVTFYEPMITLDYLLRKQNEQFNIKQPAAWQTPGYYPTKYSIRYDEQKRDIIVLLEGFVKR